MRLFRATLAKAAGLGLDSVRITRLRLAEPDGSVRLPDGW